MDAPDVIVGWLQNDYGKLGRAGEALAHAMAAEGIARRVAYVEPFEPAPGDAELQRSPIEGVDVYRGRGGLTAGRHELAQTVISASGLEDPVLFNCGVIESNWFFHYEFAPFCSATALLPHDKIHLWDVVADRRAQLETIRLLLARSSDVVCGLSQGSIDDLPGAVYVGHGRDEIWGTEGIDATAEPADLAAIGHPRAMYVGALSMRFDVEAAAALARAGIEVVLIGFDPTPAVQALIAAEPHVHFLGQKAVDETPGYLLHGDVGVIPHTDEPFTRTMEPHKAYNYAAGGLRTVTIRTHTAPVLDEFVTTTETVEDFVAATRRALDLGRLDTDATARARGLTWGAVARRILGHVDALR